MSDGGEGVSFHRSVVEEVGGKMGAIEREVFEEIRQRLMGIERDHQVRIVYACESGSRAWGFESEDSDYDVRFVYVRPREWYLAIDVEHRRDVIELPVNEVLDINGWDLRKALKLFQKSNPPLNEWLFSPVVYLEQGSFMERMRKLAPLTYNPIAAHYHYLRMAVNSVRNYLNGETVRTKKYLYALRPLLAVRWLEAGRGLVPTEFERLIDAGVSDGGLLAEIQELLRMKRAGLEKDMGPRMPQIHAFIEAEMARHGEAAPKDAGERADMSALNELFREIVHEIEI